LALGERGQPFGYAPLLGIHFGRKSNKQTNKNNLLILESFSIFLSKFGGRHKPLAALRCGPERWPKVAKSGQKVAKSGQKWQKWAKKSDT